MKKQIIWSICIVLGGSMMALARIKGNSADDLSKSTARATKEHPFENSLGMKFVPVPGKQALFSIWVTRVRDYRVYAAANFGVDAGWKHAGTKEGEEFKQGEDYPVVKVNWWDAKAFCAWLTQKERKEGKIGQDQEYRLPTRKEWSAAVGPDKYPWGNRLPPPKEGAGDYDCDDIEDRCPVGSFKANRYGLYDMGGLVWQWCEDLWNPAKKDYSHYLSGASYYYRDPDDLATCVYEPSGRRREISYGFRCVLVVGPSR